MPTKRRNLSVPTKRRKPQKRVVDDPRIRELYEYAQSIKRRMPGTVFDYPLVEYDWIGEFSGEWRPEDWEIHAHGVQITRRDGNVLWIEGFTHYDELRFQWLYQLPAEVKRLQSLRPMVLRTRAEHPHLDVDEFDRPGAFSSESSLVLFEGKRDIRKSGEEPLVRLKQIIRGFIDNAPPLELQLNPTGESKMATKKRRAAPSRYAKSRVDRLYKRQKELEMALDQTKYDLRYCEDYLEGGVSVEESGGITMREIPNLPRNVDYRLPSPTYDGKSRH